MIDNLQMVQSLRDRIIKLEATIENNRINYNNLQNKLSRALDGRNIASLMSKNELTLISALKTLKNRLGRRDKTIISLNDTIKDLRNNKKVVVLPK